MPTHALSRAQSDFFLSGLTADPAQRHDGRSLLAFRPLHVESDIAAQANGSATVNLGGTHVVCGVKAEVRSFADDLEDQEADDLAGDDDYDDLDADQDGDGTPSTGRGKVKCSIECSQSILHTFDARHIDTLTASLTSTVSSVFSARSSPIPLSQLVIIPRAKHWTLYVDILVTSLSGGNLFDAVFAAIFAALYGTRVPTTRGVAFEAPSTVSATGDDGSTRGAFENVKGDLDQMGIKGLLRSNKEAAQARGAAAGDGAGTKAASNKIVDFELENQQDEGFRLEARENVPLCITVNVLPKTYLLDATIDEEACIPSRVHVIASRTGRIHAVKVQGSQEIASGRINEAIRIGTTQASRLADALRAQLDAEAGDDEDQEEGEEGEEVDGMALDV
ncbi:uncharacterized protein PFL1_06136 [Pseudozyma flocculosa PF-1]|uniref:Ribosomal RNA-processing protein 42 n=1 Tax=Pseudozyma flocculosa PF-1 TaxID=1277687 RepID=A0A061H6G8_9BASI|nr:uncharacterized protein PFL1_06136 [Pseudozyma flocculosa PF-1]EPQ26201.1 hypothetical protein PFL1_06136 [Pseudozyma flocculosa PF-1]